MTEPLVDHAGQPSATDPASTHATPSGTALACSGGGIRSASYNLGALQVLARERVLERDVTLVSAVSGGAYLASSYLLVAASWGQRPGGLPLGQAYRPGSPEERHLRQHTRYLLPTAASGLRAVLCIAFGLALNLSLLLGWIVLLVLPVGAWLDRVGVLKDGTHFALQTSGNAALAWQVPAALLGLTLLLFAASSSGVSALHRRAFHPDRSTVSPPAQGCSTVWEEDGWRPRWLSCAGAERAMWWTFLAAAGTAYLVLLAPWLVAQVLETHVTLNMLPDNNPGTVGTGLGSFFLALLATVRLVLGSLRGDKGTAAGPATPAGTEQTGGRLSGATRLVSGLPKSIVSRVRHMLVPWVGSAIAVALLVGASLVALHTAARADPVDLLLAWSGVLVYLLLMRLLVDVNRTSLHSLYRDRLASAFAVRRGQHDVVQPAGQALLSDVRGTTEATVPGLVICATANITASGQVPAGRNGVSFTFTQRDAGLERPLSQLVGRPDSDGLYRRVPMEDYERVVGARHLSLFDVVALSGAAVSPIMGSSTRPAERFLLALGNVRLGVWLPHPALMPVHAAGRVAPPVFTQAEHGPVDAPRLGEQPVPPVPADHVERTMLKDLRRGRAARLSRHLAARLQISDLEQAEEQRGPGLWRRVINELRWRSLQPNVRMLLVEALGVTSLGDRWLYVTDGGHYENLGLVEALRRRPAEVLVFDASADRTGTWATIGEAVALARSELGVTIDIQPNDMAEKDGVISQPFVKGHYRYADEPQDTRHDLWLCKLGVPKNAPWDVRAFALTHSAFPVDSTLKQLYDGREFEAYRALGEYTADQMLRARRDLQQAREDLRVEEQKSGLVVQDDLERMNATPDGLVDVVTGRMLVPHPRGWVGVSWWRAKDDGRAASL